MHKCHEYGGYITQFFEKSSDKILNFFGIDKFLSWYENNYRNNAFLFHSLL